MCACVLAENPALPSALASGRPHPAAGRGQRQWRPGAWDVGDCWVHLVLCCAGACEAQGGAVGPRCVSRSCLPWQHHCADITRHLRHPGGQPEPQPPAESVQQLCRPRTHCQCWLDGTVKGQVQHIAIPVSSSRPSCSKLRPGLPGRTNFLASKATTSTFPGPSERQRENALGSVAP